MLRKYFRRGRIGSVKNHMFALIGPSLFPCVQNNKDNTESVPSVADLFTWIQSQEKTLLLLDQHPDALILRSSNPPSLLTCPVYLRPVFMAMSLEYIWTRFNLCTRYTKHVFLAVTRAKSCQCSMRNVPFSDKIFGSRLLETLAIQSETWATHQIWSLPNKV